MMTILIILAIILAIPVGLVVAWNLLKLLWALISDLAGLIFAVIVVVVISLIVIVLL